MFRPDALLREVMNLLIILSIFSWRAEHTRGYLFRRDTQLTWESGSLIADSSLFGQVHITPIYMPTLSATSMHVLAILIAHLYHFFSLRQ